MMKLKINSLSGSLEREVADTDGRTFLQYAHDILMEPARDESELNTLVAIYEVFRSGPARVEIDNCSGILSCWDLGRDAMKPYAQDERDLEVRVVSGRTIGVSVYVKAEEAIAYDKFEHDVDRTALHRYAEWQKGRMGQ